MIYIPGGPTVSMTRALVGELSIKGKVTLWLGLEKNLSPQLGEKEVYQGRR